MPRARVVKRDKTFLATLKSTYLDCMRLIEMQIRNLGARTSIGDKLTWQNGLADGF